MTLWCMVWDSDIWPSDAWSQIKINDKVSPRSNFTTLSSQYKVKMKNNDTLVLVQGQNEEQRPSCLSARSIQKSIFTTLSSQYKVKMKNNDPLVSIQGQNGEQRPSRLSTRSKWRTTTLSSEYKVTSIQNLWSSRLSTRSKWKKKRPSRLSTRSVQIQNLQLSYLNTRSV